MNRRDLIRRLEAVGFSLARSTGPHDVYKRASDGKTIPVPRHRVIKKRTALRILRAAGA